MKAPSLWRKRKGGRAYGTWYVETRKDGRINLHTPDAELARRRAKLAQRGVTHFEDDGGDAAAVADTVIAAVAGTDAAKPTPVVEAPPAEGEATYPGVGSAPGVQHQPAAGGATPAPARPDTYYPPPPTPAGSSWAGALGEAAAATEGAAGGDGGAAGPSEETPGLPSDLISQIIEQAAMVAVELQVLAQEWLMRRGVWGLPKIKAAPVPPDARGREMGRKLWEAELRRWMPADLPIPGWLAAPLIVLATTLPVQLGEGAAIVQDDKAPSEAAPPA